MKSVQCPNKDSFTNVCEGVCVKVWRQRKKHEKTISSSLCDMDMAEIACTVNTALELLEYELNASFKADLAHLCFLR